MIDILLQSDHPVTDSRYLLYQAQLAYLYGLPEHLAIASVTSTPAEVMGLGHRIGYVKEGMYLALYILFLGLTNEFARLGRWYDFRL